MGSKKDRDGSRQNDNGTAAAMMGIGTPTQTGRRLGDEAGQQRGDSDDNDSTRDNGSWITTPSHVLYGDEVFSFSFFRLN
jgi:hypothetical protein